ncbi:hypothetical protein [Janthinobacterium sp. PAMC25594]|uniref:hypothetical protein n=1 Tax=Janthinobacterium sp. PAMC25594 TaxID=2861284 RepID=UPI001C62BA5D|nr:hypothetical protein [Janthinobacterium sp. PAMC25594]QYG07297.1 hypothetical protein KY494_00210 [Janthinobacterium sp. PAMC25594]
MRSARPTSPFFFLSLLFLPVAACAEDAPLQKVEISAASDDLPQYGDSSLARPCAWRTSCPILPIC